MTDWKELLPELDEIRNRGYAIEREEVELGMACVAAPIFRSGRITAAISVSGPAERVADANRETTIEPLSRRPATSAKPWTESGVISFAINEKCSSM